MRPGATPTQRSLPPSLQQLDVRFWEQFLAPIQTICSIFSPEISKNLRKNIHDISMRPTIWHMKQIVFDLWETRNQKHPRCPSLLLQPFIMCWGPIMDSISNKDLVAHEHLPLASREGSHYHEHRHVMSTSGELTCGCYPQNSDRLLVKLLVKLLSTPIDQRFFFAGNPGTTRNDPRWSKWPLPYISAKETNHSGCIWKTRRPPGVPTFYPTMDGLFHGKSYWNGWGLGLAATPHDFGNLLSAGVPATCRCWVPAEVSADFFGEIQLLGLPKRLTLFEFCEKKKNSANLRSLLFLTSL